MLNRLRSVSWALACVTAGFLLSDWMHRLAGATRPGQPSHHTAPTVEQLRRLSTLVTTRVEVADVQESRITGYTGGVRAVLLIKGDLLLGTDLSRARLEAVDPAARTAVLVLSPPAVTSPRVDHERTRLYAVNESGLWRVVPGDAAYAAAVNEAYIEAQHRVADVGEDVSVRDRSRRQAEQVLACFYETLGWRVKARWSGE
jgi:hypothetical protein